MHEQSVSKSEINNLKINNKNIMYSTLYKALKDSRNKKKKTVK